MRKSGITALTAAIALSLGAVPLAFTVQSILALGEVTTLSPASASAGTLTLSTTSAQGTVAWSGSNSLMQSFSEGPDFCGVTNTPESDDLLQLTGTIGDGSDDTGAAGFRGGDIGAFEFSNASQCFRVDAASFTPQETLNLALGDDLVETLGVAEEVPLLASSATVSLTKQPGDLLVRWTALLNGEVVESNTWSSPKKGNQTAVSTGPIAPKDADENAQPFDEVRLTAEMGSFSLRGASFSLISDVDATFCDPETVDGGGVPGAVNSLTKDNTTVTYLGNVSGGASCFGVRLTSGPDEVQFLKPLTVARDAEFIFDIDWDLEDTDAWTPDVSLPAAFIDFELRFDSNGVPISAEHELPFCHSDLFDTDGNLVGLQGADPEGVLDDWEQEGIPGDEGTQYACIGSRKVLAEVPFTATDQIYLIGDAKMRW